MLFTSGDSVTPMTTRSLRLSSGPMVPRLEGR